MRSVSPAAVAAARKRAAVETYARNETALRRTARRYSLCGDDAEDALQRGLEILLRKAPTDDPRELVKWMQKVVKHEALAIREDRERIVPGADDWIALLPADGEGPAERVERREAIARSREALRTLKPQELRALSLLAEGYSYAEIGEITGFSRTKVNRCLSEGRARFRKLLAHSEEGGRCAEMGALISAFCDGEAAPEQAAELREHLRACAHCRATLRAYRAAPAAAGALAPSLPLARSLFGRLRGACSDGAARIGGGKGAAIPRVFAGNGAGGGGVAAVAKVAAVCLSAAGGAACVATGVVPAPLGLGPGQSPPHQIESSRLAPRPRNAVAVKREPAPGAVSPPAPKEKPAPAPHEAAKAPEEPEPAAGEPTPAAAEAGEEVVEYPSPPATEPAAETASAGGSGGGNPAGEFGP